MFPNVDSVFGPARLVRNAEVLWKGRACPAIRRLRSIGTDFPRWRRKWLLAFGFERVVQCGQVLREQLIELFRHLSSSRLSVSM